MGTDIIRTEDGSLDASSYKGLTGTIDFDGLTVQVVVTDARLAYGRLDFRVTPKSGSGEKWVASKSVTTSPMPQQKEAVVLHMTSAVDTPKVPTFRDEVALARANRSRVDAEATYKQIKSYMDLLIQKEETND